MAHKLYNFADRYALQAETSAKLTEMRKERDMLKTLNDTLLQNSEVFKTRMKAAESTASQSKSKISDLEDQVSPIF